MGTQSALLSANLCKLHSPRPAPSVFLYLKRERAGEAEYLGHSYSMSVHLSMPCLEATLLHYAHGQVFA